MLLRRLANTAGARRNPYLHGKEFVMQASLAQIVLRQDGPVVPDQLQRVRRKIACTLICGYLQGLSQEQSCQSWCGFTAALLWGEAALVPTYRGNNLPDKESS